MMQNYAKPLRVEPPLELVETGSSSLLRIAPGDIQARLGNCSSSSSGMACGCSGMCGPDYEWCEIEYVGDGVWQTKEGGRTSGDRDGYGKLPNAAYERTGVCVAPGTFVTLHPGGFNGDYWFDHCCAFECNPSSSSSSSSSDCIEVVSDVECVDGRLKVTKIKIRATLCDGSSSSS
jgi:hypothetical protein